VCGEALAGCRVGGGRASGAVAAAEDVCAYDEEVVCVEGLSWADELLPPAWGGIQGSGGGVGGSR